MIVDTKTRPKTKTLCWWNLWFATAPGASHHANRSQGSQGDDVFLEGFLFGCFGGQVTVLNLKLYNGHHQITFPETNIAPENRSSQKEISFSNHPFAGAMLVSGRVVSYRFFLCDIDRCFVPTISQTCGGAGRKCTKSGQSNSAGQRCENGGER